MDKILGLDLGTNSIGWAIRHIDHHVENQIVHKGVLTFDKGVAEDKSGEHPMVQKRTEARGKRRNYQAQKYRKWELLECLINNNMCPLTINELNDWRHYTKGIGRRYPLSKKFIEWLRFDFDGDSKPDFERFGFEKHESYYLFRKLIVDINKTEIFTQEPHIIGRVLYQLVQRRGYNDGMDLDEEEIKELSSTIMKGGGDSGAIGVNNIRPYIEQHKTLGAALYHVQKEQKARIRKRYNLRSDYAKELKEICNIQKINHLYVQLWSAIIWQRPLRSQKGLVGYCTYNTPIINENNKFIKPGIKRCPISHPIFEEYRTWIFINNLKIEPIENEKNKNEQDLIKDKLEVIKNVVYPLFFKSSSDFKLSSIKKALEKVNYQVNARFPDDTKVISFSFLYKMKEIFGENWSEIIGWENYLSDKPKCQEYDIQDLWHLHFNKSPNKKTGEEPQEYLKRFALSKLKLDEVTSNLFSKIQLHQGYATLSIQAIRKILPYLKQGFLYHEAVYLANLPKVMGRFFNPDDVNHYAEIVRKIIKDDKYDREKYTITNNIINSYFNDKDYFENNELKIIRDEVVNYYGNNSWNAFSTNTKASIEDDIILEVKKFKYEDKKKPENHYRKTGRLHDKIFTAFMNDYGLPNENIKHLWHPTEQDTYAPAIEKEGKAYLGSPEPISRGFKNPMALKTLHHLKKLVNYLIESDKIDKNTRIVIEIARELNDANKRKAIEKWQRERERQNEIYKKQIESLNNDTGSSLDSNNPVLIDKIRLWEEQGKVCIYTGKTISLYELLKGNQYDLEHTVPASMSFDNELKNLTIADSTYNRTIKQKKLPSQCDNYRENFIKDNQTYPAILFTLQHMLGDLKEFEIKVKGKKEAVKKISFTKIISLERELAEWKNKSSDNKQIKDNIIIRRHQIKMELDYWRSKMNSFLITEYKAGWRNSQLRDTQTITKYALPYLKTVFSQVEVQKGAITADFRKIYRVQPRLDKKDRTKHSHHAIDAAVLTLIPPAATRDKILSRFNEANENKQDFHAKPNGWLNFNTSHLLNIENEVLNNYQATHRTHTPTYKIVRKRGRIQYVKEKLPDGRWQYKLDGQGNKIPIVAQGDSIRGQLHKDSYFGAILNKGTLNLVERYPIAAFSNIKDCRNIIDDAVRKIVEETIMKRMNSGQTFDKAKLEPIPFPNGKALIKKVRCRVAAGRGYLTPEKAIEIQKHTFLSKHKYKHHIYAQNDQNVYCLFYELTEDNNIHRAYRIISLFELAKLKINNTNYFFNDSAFNSAETGRGANIKILPLKAVLKVGQKVIFYKESIDELKEIGFEVNNRIFIIYKFNIAGSPLIYLKNHIEARSNDELEADETVFNPNKYQNRLKIVASKFQGAIEGIDFKLSIDGRIVWLK
jgi:CRISPR-associated endonuclease Csn1